MENDDFIKKLEHLDKPNVGETQHRDAIKLTVLGAKKSAALGVWLVAVPAFFLFCIFMKYMIFKSKGTSIDVFEEMLSTWDKNPTSWFIAPMAFIGFPLLALVLNILAVTHYSFDKNRKELSVQFKFTWYNWLILLTALAIIGVFASYLISDFILENHSKR